MDVDAKLSTKTRFEYRKYTDSYVRPLLGKKKARDVTTATILEWQRSLAKGGGVKKGKGLAPNTIRLARPPLSNAFKTALNHGLASINPVAPTPRPRAARSIPKHWSPEQSRTFLHALEGDRSYPVRA